MRLSLPRSLPDNPLQRLQPGWRDALRSPLVIALVASSGRGLVPASDSLPLLDLQADPITEIAITGDEGQVRLAREGDGWVLAELDGFPADNTRVQALLDTLVGLRRPLPVATTEEARQRFKVAADDHERVLTLHSHTDKLATLIVGDSPGFRRVYARLDDEQAIYALPLALFDLSADADDWVARDQLRLDAEAITGVATDDWAVIKDADGWRLQEADGESDRDAIADLVRRIANLGYQGVIGTEPPTEADLDSPALTLDISLGDGSTRSYRIAALGDDDMTDYVLTSTSGPYAFRLSAYELDGVIDVERASLVLTPDDDADTPSPAMDAEAPSEPDADATGSAEQPGDAALATEPTETDPQPAAAMPPGDEDVAAEPQRPPDAQPADADQASPLTVDETAATAPPAEDQAQQDQTQVQQVEQPEPPPPSASPATPATDAPASPAAQPPPPATQAPAAPPARPDPWGRPQIPPGGRPPWPPHMPPPGWR
jgi:hypothetical protein